MIFLKLREGAGWASGYAMGLGTGITALLRQSRMFHPRGMTYQARVVPISNPNVGFDLNLFAGTAVLRLSSAWWKKVEWRDVLGIAVRFTQTRNPKEEADPQDQDLLFATIQYPWTTPLGPFTTKYHDFLANEFYAVSPFMFEEDNSLFKIRLSPQMKTSGKASKISRAQRFENAVKEGTAAFDLQVQLKGRKKWESLAKIEVLHALPLDQEKLRFSPFQTGLKLHPRGYVHFLRVGTYRMSQALRPKKK